MNPSVKVQCKCGQYLEVLKISESFASAPVIEVKEHNCLEIKPMSDDDIIDVDESQVDNLID